jgi:hypothetical protein
VITFFIVRAFSWIPISSLGGFGGLLVDQHFPPRSAPP